MKAPVALLLACAALCGCGRPGITAATAKADDEARVIFYCSHMTGEAAAKCFFAAGITSNQLAAIRWTLRSNAVEYLAQRPPSSLLGMKESLAKGTARAGWTEDEINDALSIKAARKVKKSR
jgi:hypothetical protein